MKSEFVTFPGSQSVELSGRFELPDEQEPRAYALFAHCFTCSKNLRAVGRIAQSLTDNGVGVLRFDFTGLGNSEGDFSDTNVSSNIEDLLAAVTYMESIGRAPQVLIGHSLGGAAVLQAAQHVPSCRAIVTIGAPSQAAHVLHLVDSHLHEIEARGEADVVLAGRRFRIKKQFVDDLAQYRMTDFIRELRRALLVMHSPIDNTVGIENAAEIFGAALHPKSFVTLDDADHLLTDDADARYAGSVIAAWSERYLS